jgi:hypothetical protein
LVFRNGIKAKKGYKIFGRNKRVTTFVAPKERERELRRKEEGLKPLFENCRIHRKSQRESAFGKRVLIFYGEQKRRVL